VPRITSELSPKEELFVAEYLIDKNGSAAAVRTGYSKRSAAKTAFDLLRKPLVKRAIEKALKAQMTRTLITADQVLKDIERIAAKAEADKEFHAALKGKELLGKHYKLFTEKHEHGGIGGGPVVLQVSSTDEAL